MAPGHEFCGKDPREADSSGECAVARFVAAWRRGERPAPEDYGTAGDVGLLAKLVRMDLTLRLKAGDCARVEDYLGRYPQLTDGHLWLLDLLETEYRLRQACEPGLSLRDYRERFPQCYAELAGRLQNATSLPPTASYPLPDAANRQTCSLTPGGTGAPTPRVDVRDGAQPVLTAAPTEGPSLPGFELLGEIGRGGMGVVYRARDCQRREIVALKTMQRLEPAALYRFKQEFRSLADLAHPNLVSLYDLVYTGAWWFFTMEYVEGTHFLAHVRAGADLACSTTVETLPAAVVPAGSWEPSPQGPAGLAPAQLDRLRRALRQLGEGLAALHAAGKLHRDIKSSNVLVTPAGRVVLVDFGLAADLDRLGRYQNPEEHLVGTVAYMSPEQAACQPLSAASDWYSVGVMLYEALAGRRPYLGRPAQLLQDKQRRDPPAPSALGAHAPGDLEALCLELLRRDPGARPSGREILDRLGAAAAESAVSAAPFSLWASSPLLIGRQRHLDALYDAFQTLRRGRPVIVYINGQSGMGKSALVQHFLGDLLPRHGAVVLGGRCYERESVPYKALDSLVDALTQHLRGLPAPEVETLLPRDAFALARVFPVLLQVGGVATAPHPGSNPPDAQELRRRAFAALRELLGRLGARQPLVLCIDDLQWGDVDSAALLTDLLRPPDPPVLLLLGCYRSEEAAASPCLRALLQEPATGLGVLDRRELAVDPLAEAEARDLALTLLGRHDPATEAQAAVVARESGGSPFFVHELVQYLQADAGPTGAAFPAGELVMDKVLWERISHLPEEARRLLEVMAVAGRPLRAREACMAAALPEDRPTLARLRSGRLIRGTGFAEQERLETYHDKVRESVTAHLAPAALAQHHERLARVLEATGTADPEVLAVHFLGAGMRDRASTQYARAAAQAAEALAFDRAANLYRKALDLRPHADAEGRRLGAHLGDALANAGRGAEAAAVYLEVARNAASAEGLDLERRATHQYLISGHVDEGLAIFRTVLNRLGMSLPSTPRRTLFALLLRRLQLRLRGLGFRPRTADQVPAAELTRIDVCWAAFTGLSLVDNIRGALFQTRGLLLALRAGEPFRIARALAMEAGHVSVAGGPSRPRVAQLLQAAQMLAQQVVDPYLTALIVFARGTAAYLEGCWQRSRELCDQGDALLRANCTGVTWELDTVRTIALWDLIRLGEYAELRRRWPALLAEAQERGDRYAVTNLSTHIMTMVRLTNDDPERARQQLREVIGAWSQQGFHIQHHNALLSSVDIDLYSGRGAAAWELMRAQRRAYTGSLLQRIQQVRIDVENWHARSALAAAVTAADPRPLLRTAAADARRIEREKMPWGDALAVLLRAGVAAGYRQTAQVVALLREAAARLDAVNLHPYAAAARARLGVLLGGDEGRALVTQAYAWMAAQQVQNPARMIALLAPGHATSTLP